MKDTAGWFIMFIGGILLIVIGFEGALGKVVGVAFCPGKLEYYDDAKTGAGAFPTSSSTSTALSTSNQFTI
jgi:hypothetical protein